MKNFFQIYIHIYILYIHFLNSVYIYSFWFSLIAFINLVFTSGIKMELEEWLLDLDPPNLFSIASSQKVFSYVSAPRSDHLYVFFMQWSPDMYGEGVRGMGQEPGFMVVKKNEVSETAEDDPITDLNVKEWEVRSTGAKLFPLLVPVVLS